MCEEPLKSHHSFKCYQNGVPRQTFSASCSDAHNVFAKLSQMKWIRSNIDQIKVKPSSLLMFMFCFVYWV